MVTGVDEPVWLIRRTAVPEDALLKTYRGGVHPEHWGHYADCFSVIIDRPIDIGAFVTAFYTSPIFRVERWVLRCVVAAPSTDADARAVAEGTGSSFAVWRVGARTGTELLMCDRYERTRSWFRVVPAAGNSTLLQFGSAVAATRPNERSGGFGASFNLLSRFHVLYSQILLHAAKARVAQMARVPTR
jgi:hypothetical protein